MSAIFIDRLRAVAAAALLCLGLLAGCAEDSLFSGWFPLTREEEELERSARNLMHVMAKESVAEHLASGALGDIIIDAEGTSLGAMLGEMYGAEDGHAHGEMQLDPAAQLAALDQLLAELRAANQAAEEMLEAMRHMLDAERSRLVALRTRSFQDEAAAAALEDEIHRMHEQHAVMEHAMAETRRAVEGYGRMRSLIIEAGPHHEPGEAASDGEAGEMEVHMEAMMADVDQQLAALQATLDAMAAIAAALAAAA